MDTEIVPIVKQVARNLGDYDKIIKTTLNEKNIRVWNGIRFPSWETTTLSHGIPGICLLYGKMMECFPNEEIWAELAHKYLKYLVEELRKTGFQTLSMFSGASGVGLAVSSVSNGFQNYNKLLNTINDYIATYYDSVFIDNAERKGTHSTYYDVIEGLTGVLSYCSLYREYDKFYRIMCNGLKKLVELTKNIEVGGNMVPAWYISSENQFSETESMLYPYGNFNTSFSHGISGPLSFLAEMKDNGIIVEDQEEAINKIVSFLFKYKLFDGERDFWKGQVDFHEYTRGKLSKDNIVRRDAWCYGNPGICYSILRAGKAMNNSSWIDYSLDNIRKTMNNIKGIFSPTFCHGYSGLYQILNSAETIIGTEIYANEKQILLEKIMSYYDPNYIFGFKNIEIGDDEENVRSFEYVGLLDGAVGVCLSLLEREYKSNSFWKKAFLLA